MLILKIIYPVYFGVIGWLVFNAISKLMFSKSKSKYRYFYRTLFFSPFWPIAMWSPEGRKVLTSKFDNF